MPTFTTKDGIQSSKYASRERQVGPNPKTTVLAGLVVLATLRRGSSCMLNCRLLAATWNRAMNVRSAQLYLVIFALTAVLLLISFIVSGQFWGFPLDYVKHEQDVRGRKRIRI